MSDDPTLPRSWNTDPAPVNAERSIDGKIRAAANLSLAVIGGQIGEEIRLVLWTYYNTDKAMRFEQLADAILAARPARTTQP